MMRKTKIKAKIRTKAKMNAKKLWALILPCFAALILLAGCAANAALQKPLKLGKPYTFNPVQVAPITLQDAPQGPMKDEMSRAQAISVSVAAPQVNVRQASEPNFSMIWMSDTQLYSESYPEIFSAMTSWTVGNKIIKNIQYVLHTGDIVNDRTKSGQWENAVKATQSIRAALPMFTVAGNHDTGANDPSYAEYAKRFDPADFPNSGGHYDDGMGRYDLFEYGAHKFIIAGLGYAHTKASVEWLNGVLKANQDRTAILCFHSYLNVDGKLTSHGREFFDNIVKSNPNVKLVLSGHKHGISKRTDDIDDDGDGKAERTVQAILGDYQASESGGNGYLQILEFNPQKQEVAVTPYSPYADDYGTGDAFTFGMDF